MIALVTGGAGFIGSNLVKKLLSEGVKVDIVDDLSSGSTENLSGFKLREIHAGMASLDRPVPDDVINFYVGDFTSEAVLERIAAKKYDVVFHLAAVPRVSYSVEFPTLTTEANLMKSVALFEVAAKSGTRVVASSSSSVYGGADVMPTPESEPRDPKSPYALQKSVMEDFGRLFNKLYGFDVVFLRYFNVFGPRQEADSGYAAVIPKFIAKMIKGEDVIIYGNGQQKRDFTYVSNVVNANLKLACMDIAAISGQVFNIAASNPVTVLEVFNHLARKLNYNRPPVFQDRRKGDIENSFADISKASVSFGFVPELNLEKGLDLTIDWFKNR